MSFRRPARFIAVAAGIAVPVSAQAQALAETEAVWAYFAETCSAVVAADNPAVYAARLPGSQGGAGQSADESLSIATVELDGVAPEGDIAILNTMVNVFEGGRSVQCMLQLPRPATELTGLSELARDRVADILGDDIVIAGGWLSEIQMNDGVPDGIGQRATYLRASRGAFPPEAVVMVQILPVFVSLTLSVSQTETAE